MCNNDAKLFDAIFFNECFFSSLYWYDVYLYDETYMYMQHVRMLMGKLADTWLFIIKEQAFNCLSLTEQKTKKSI